MQDYWCLHRELANDPRSDSIIAFQAFFLMNSQMLFDAAQPSLHTEYHNQMACQNRPSCKVFGPQPSYLFRVCHSQNQHAIYWRISDRNQGFFCVGCSKLYPLTPAQPQPTFAAGRRSAKPQALTKRQILEERRLAFKKTRGAQKRDKQTGSKLIRGRWLSAGWYLIWKI